MITITKNLNNNINSTYRVALEHLFNNFVTAKQELFLVGGCVRDLLLERKPKDYDLCTNLVPEDVKKLLKDIRYIRPTDGIPEIVSKYSFIDTGLKHGTITIYDKEYDLCFEITTYRKDADYGDHRHPDTVEFTTSLEEDLARRDFTINSFAYNYISKEILALEESYLEDLRLGILRTVGRAEDRFSEDALRMLRAIRFAAQYNLTIDPDTYAAIKTCGKYLVNISKERIRDELTKILLSDNPQLLELLVCCDIEKYLFDGLTPITDTIYCEQQNKWHYTDVFHHTMDVVKRVPKTFELRWAAFFHDLGKPATKRLKTNGSGEYNYHGHPVVSAEIAAKLMEILKFSNLTTNIIAKFVKFHDSELTLCKMSKFKKVYVEIGDENFESYIQLRIADAAAHRLILDTRYYIDSIKVYYDRLNIIRNEKPALLIKDLAINGHDLIAIGYCGKEIGDELKNLLEYILEHPEDNNQDYLLQQAKLDFEGLHE